MANYPPIIIKNGRMQQLQPNDCLIVTGNTAVPNFIAGSSNSPGYYWRFGRENLTTGDFIWLTANGGAESERMRLTVAGGLNIGGTADPGNNGQLALTATSSSYTGSVLRFNWTVGGSSRNWAALSNNLAWADFGFMQSSAAGGDPVTAGAYRLYIGASGGVNIGGTADPGAGCLALTGANNTINMQGVSGNAVIIGGTGGLYWNNNANNFTTMLLRDGGSLQIYSNSNTGYFIASTNASNNDCGFSIAGPGNAKWIIYSNWATTGATDDLVFHKTAGTTGPKMSINDAGNVIFYNRINVGYNGAISAALTQSVAAFRSPGSTRGHIVMSDDNTASLFLNWGGNLPGRVSSDSSLELYAGAQYSTGGEGGYFGLRVHGSSGGISIGNQNDPGSGCLWIGADHNHGASPQPARLLLMCDQGVSHQRMLSFREGSNAAYGFDWTQDDYATGNMRLYRVTAGTSTRIMEFWRGSGGITIGDGSLVGTGDPGTGNLWIDGGFKQGGATLILGQFSNSGTVYFGAFSNTYPYYLSLYTGSPYYYNFAAGITTIADGYTIRSSRQLKRNIKDWNPKDRGRLRPRTFERAGRPGIIEVGFVAEEVGMKDLVKAGPSGAAAYPDDPDKVPSLDLAAILAKHELDIQELQDILALWTQKQKTQRPTRKR